MKQTRILCDFCKKENTVEVAFYAGGGDSPFGVSTFDVYDFCIHCLKQKFIDLVELSRPEIGRVYLNRLKKARLKNE